MRAASRSGSALRNCVTVRDNGRGIPVAPILVSRTIGPRGDSDDLAFGGKFGGDAYRTRVACTVSVSSVVNALSDEFGRVARDGSCGCQSYAGEHRERRSWTAGRYPPRHDRALPSRSRDFRRPRIPPATLYRMARPRPICSVALRSAGAATPAVPRRRVSGRRRGFTSRAVSAFLARISTGECC